MKKLITLLVTLSVILLAACSKQADQNEIDSKTANGLKTVVIASTGSDADIWRYIATLPETKAAGIQLEVKNFTDYVSMNTAVANQEVDLNAFQSYAYLVAFNAANKDKIAPVSTTYLEPMGIYSNKVKKVDEFANGATIAIPNDGANESRALLLLQTAGIIKLKADFDPVKGTPADIIENSKNIVIKPIQMATAVRVKDEVDAILHQIELHQREINGDGTPYGLSLILNGLGSAIHHSDPIEVWDVDAAIDHVKQELKDPMWLSNLIQTHLIDNPHRVQMTLVPDATKSLKEQQAEQAQLAEITAKLTEAQKVEIREKTEALKQRQDTPDDLELLPKVGLEDVPADLQIVQGQLREIICNGLDTPLNLSHAGTNGMYYQ